MSDIVDRLREGLAGSNSELEIDGMMDLAADEIERLRREADEVRNAVIALMEWVWPIAGDNQNPHEACIELNTAERVRELLDLRDDDDADDGQPDEVKEWQDYDRDC